MKYGKYFQKCGHPNLFACFSVFRCSLGILIIFWLIFGQNDQDLINCILHLSISLFIMCFFHPNFPNHQSGFCYCHHISQIVVAIVSYLQAIIFIANIFTNVSCDICDLAPYLTTHLLTWCLFLTSSKMSSFQYYWNATHVICGQNVTHYFNQGGTKLQLFFKIFWSLCPP